VRVKGERRALDGPRSSISLAGIRWIQIGFFGKRVRLRRGDGLFLWDSVRLLRLRLWRSAFALGIEHLACHRTLL
jgi:hypothetical protein